MKVEVQEGCHLLYEGSEYKAGDIVDMEGEMLESYLESRTVREYVEPKPKKKSSKETKK